MEIASPRSCELAEAVLQSPLIVVATVMEKPHPFVDQLKRRQDVEVIDVTFSESR